MTGDLVGSGMLTRKRVVVGRGSGLSNQAFGREIRSATSWLASFNWASAAADA